MRNLKEHEEVTNVISLGLLATRLRLSLLNKKGSASIVGDGSLLQRWDTILEETVNFIESPITPTVITGTAQTIMPHFLSRAGYLEQFRSAAPPRKSKTPKELSAYLKKIQDSLKVLENKKTLRSSLKDELEDFLSSISKGCIQEAARLQQEPHPKWSPEPISTRA